MGRPASRSSSSLSESSDTSVISEASPRRRGTPRPTPVAARAVHAVRRPLGLSGPREASGARGTMAVSEGRKRTGTDTGLPKALTASLGRGLGNRGLTTGASAVENRRGSRPRGESSGDSAIDAPRGISRRRGVPGLDKDDAEDDAEDDRRAAARAAWRTARWGGTWRGSDSVVGSGSAGSAGSNGRSDESSGGDGGGDGARGGGPRSVHTLEKQKWMMMTESGHTDKREERVQRELRCLSRS